MREHTLWVPEGDMRYVNRIMERSDYPVREDEVINNWTAIIDQDTEVDLRLIGGETPCMKAVLFERDESGHFRYINASEIASALIGNFILKDSAGQDVVLHVTLKPKGVTVC